MRMLPIPRAPMIMRWALPLGILAVVVAMLIPARSGQDYSVEPLILLLALLGALIIFVIIHALTFPLGMAIIHRGIRSATEGTLQPIETSRRIRYFFGMIIDDYNILIRNMGSLFREMEQSQLSIIADRNRNDAILRSLPGALMTVDGNFQVTLSNNLAEHLFNLPASQLLGQNLFELLQLNDDGRELLREAFLYEQQISNKEIVLRNGNQSRYYTLNLNFFRETINAADYCAAVMLQDITDFKYMQELVHRSEKFLAIGQLAGGVAHELNTPLGTIVGYAQLLNEGVASEERRLDYSQRIYREAKRCAHIIENLRAVAQRDVCRPETCNIDVVIREVIDTVSNCPSKTHQARIRSKLACNSMVQGGPGQLDIVLVNVLMNAVQAATDGSDAPLVTILSAIDGETAVVSITDNGPGIPAGQYHQVFDPFFTTKKESAGIGLGLAISQSIVTRIGGSLRCDPDYRDGARFLLTLPLAASGA